MIFTKMMPQKYKYIFKRKRKNRSLRIKYVTRNIFLISKFHSLIDLYFTIFPPFKQQIALKKTLLFLFFYATYTKQYFVNIN